jgi:hypothetical protein
MQRYESLHVKSTFTRSLLNSGWYNNWYVLIRVTPNTLDGTNYQYVALIAPLVVLNYYIEYVEAIEYGIFYSWRGSPSVAAIHICNKPV